VGLTNIAESLFAACGKALPQNESKENKRTREKVFMQLSVINGLTSLHLLLRIAVGLNRRATHDFTKNRPGVGPYAARYPRMDDI
jgi:hypothetical protein